MELKRKTRFEVSKGVISQFQLETSERHKRKIKAITSKNDRELLKYHYTELSGYITLYGEDIEEITVLFE